MPDSDIAQEIRDRLRTLMWFTILLYGVVIALCLFAWWYSHQTRQTLCTFRNDLAQRVVSSEKFLAEHPNGGLGFSRVDIQNTIKNQQRTIDSLSGLHCANPAVAPVKSAQPWTP